MPGTIYSLGLGGEEKTRRNSDIIVKATGDSGSTKAGAIAASVSNEDRTSFLKPPLDCTVGGAFVLYVCLLLPCVRISGRYQLALAGTSGLCLGSDSIRGTAPRPHEGFCRHVPLIVKRQYIQCFYN